MKFQMALSQNSEHYYRKWILPVQFDAQMNIVNIVQMQYWITEKKVVNKILQNNISVTDSTSIFSKQLNPSEEQDSINKKLERLIYPEQMLFLTMVCQYPDYLQYQNRSQNNVTNRNQYQRWKQENVLQIYKNLDQKGFNSFDCLQFFLMVRKRGKLLHRSNILDNKINVFEIYLNSDDFKSNSNFDLVQVVKTRDFVKQLLISDTSIKNKFKICIMANNDYVILEKLNKISV